MDVRELAIAGAFEFSPKVFPDRRGSFAAPFQQDQFAAAIGHPLTVAQSNHSVSARGTIRGIHFASLPPGQAKYVYCARGSVLDVVVDIRIGSPTFGQSDMVLLSAREFNAVYLPVGLGHAFAALEHNTAVSYLCSAAYNPAKEHGINPLDPELRLRWPTSLSPILSDKDATAPTLAEARDAGLLPSYDDCRPQDESAAQIRHIDAS